MDVGRPRPQSRGRIMPGYVSRSHNAGASAEARLSFPTGLGGWCRRESEFYNALRFRADPSGWRQVLGMLIDGFCGWHVCRQC